MDAYFHGIPRIIYLMYAQKINKYVKNLKVEKPKTSNHVSEGCVWVIIS